jgi:predicted ATPase/DNA-binding SARP family transcriptional activator/DNA-binding CsgD family transcriptional regulator
MTGDSGRRAGAAIHPGVAGQPLGVSSISEPGDDRLRIYLLGEFRVMLADGTISGAWRLRRASTLVKLLALAPYHRLHREQVLDTLWPDADPAAAANNLHNVLHFVRRAIDPSSASGIVCHLQNEQVSLGPLGRIWTDVESFESAAAVARRTQQPADYRSALGLYAGDLLPGDLYDDWTTVPREGLRSTWLSLLLELAELEEQRGSLVLAIEVLHEAVEREPALEEAHAALMQLFARMGQRQLALRQFDQLRRVLKEELDTEPTAETMRLHEEILAGRLTPAQPAVSTGSRRHNFPAPLTSFVGRTDEIAEVRRLLISSRLLTLTGAGGAGKTRLAMEAASQMLATYPDGVWLVELAALSSPELVTQAVAAAVDVREQAVEPLEVTLTTSLRQKRLLLVFDNCEHLLANCAKLIHTLLRECPEIQVLATSREALGIQGEVIGPVPPLSLPEIGERVALEDTLTAEAVGLFVDRATFRQPGFRLTAENAQAVARICRQVDGIPLAIELAAARIGMLSPDQIAARAERSLDVLSRKSSTTPARQQTLRATLDWSYNLLEQAERRLFAHLSVFTGGWTLEEAERIIEAGDVLESLSQLVDKSLVAAEGSSDGTVRYRMLEPVRQYARGLLKESGLEPLVRSRHAQLYLQLGESAAPHLRGTGQAIWLDRLQIEESNLREALAWAFSDGGDAAVGIRLAGRIWRFWASRSTMAEGQRWLQEAMDHGDRVDPHELVDVVYAGATLAYWQEDYRRAAQLLARSRRLYTDLGDDKGIAWCLTMLGTIAFQKGERARATELQEQALALRQKIGDRYGIAGNLGELGLIADEIGDLERSQELQEESLAIYREFDNQLLVGILLGNLAIIARKRSDFPRARSLLTESLSHLRAVGDKRIVAVDLDLFAIVASHEGQPGRAARLLGAADLLRESIGAPRQLNVIRMLDDVIPGLRARLGESVYSVLYSAGGAMTLEDAVAYAVSTPVDEPEYAGDAFSLPSTEELASLSPREREIASLVSEGLTNRRISDRLGISQRTVDTHVGNILRKLGLTSRARLAACIDYDRETGSWNRCT